MSDTVLAATPSAPAPILHQPTAWHNGSRFGFRDLVDIINPLQHLPIIGSIYRWATGDRPGEAAQIAGDALYGGPIGVGVGLLSAWAEDSQGRDLGERAIAAVFGPGDKSNAVAAATPPAGAAAPSPQAAAAPPPPARPDHPPMPLFGGIALPTGPAAAASAAPKNDAARDFLARNAALERQVSNGSRPPATAPVPLVLPPGSLQMPMPRSAPAPSAAAGGSAAAGAPIDISRKMQDALDKYMRLEQERKTHPDAPPAPAAVDLSM